MRLRTLGIMLLLATGLGNGAQAAPVVGEPAPALAADAADGGAVDLARWRGKTVLVSYWATWCEPCKREIPVLDALYRANHDRGLEVLVISIDFPRDRQKAREAMQPFAFHAVHASQLTTDDFGKPRGVPTGYLIDAKGIVLDAFASIRQDDMQKVLDTLLTNQNHQERQP